tara:strand:+ start:375 stop:1124 length:750 start_codon:yes stop_codon:yes gene_type:complete
VIKPSLTLCPGLPRSGTTSLWYMLEKVKFFNIICKEPHFLTVLSDDKTDCPTFFPKEYKNRYHQYVYSLNEIEPPYSLDLYKKYIKDSSYDFSQSYWYISENYLEEIKQSLSDFDIKIILLYRDPVMRLYSYWNMVCSDWNLDYTPIQLYYMSLERDDCINLYPNLYNKFKRVFDNVICLKTETFFTNDKEQQRLLNFLGLPLVELDNIYKNRSDVCSQLSANDIEIGKHKLKSSYDFYLNNAIFEGKR